MAEQNRRIPRANRRSESRLAKASARQVKREKSNSRDSTSGFAVYNAKLAAYFQHHKASANKSLIQLGVAPWQSFLTCLVIAIALALPSMLYLFLDNVQSQTHQWDQPAQISVYLHKDAKQTAIDQLQQRLSENAVTDSVVFVSAEAGLSQFQSVSGFGDILDSLEDNPIPPVLVITPNQLELAQLEAFTAQARTDAIVESVQMDFEWLAKLEQLIRLGGRIVAALSLIFGLAVVLVIGNIIRLAIASRIDEIVITKLVGGTDAFVRRPFLYTGMWYGIGGGVLALVIVVIAQWWLSEPISKLAQLYQSQIDVSGFSFSQSIMIIASACILSSMGAWLAVSRHLAEIKPE